jgi:hypothetical protein
MMERRESAGGYDYVVPARTLRGSTEEVLAELDEAVEGLLALRQLIALGKVPRSGGVTCRPRGPVAWPRKRPEDQ